MLAEQMPLAEVKNRLSEVVEAVEREHGRLVITKHGRPAAVVISVDDLDGLEETLDIMSHSALLDDIRKALTDRHDHEPIVLSKDEALRLATSE
jgi:prevent-host-death family protein